MWIKNNVYAIWFNRHTWWLSKKGLLIETQHNSGQILCQKGSFTELIDFLEGKFIGESDKFNHNKILPDDKLKLLSFFKGVEAYCKKNGSKISTEEFDIILENFLDIFINKKSWVRKVYNYLTIEEQE